MSVQERGEVEAAVRALLDDLVADDPVLGTALGMTEGAGRLPSWSAAALERRRELLHEHERRLTPLLAADDTGAAVDAFAALQVVRRRLRALELRRVAQRHPGAVLEVVAGVFPLLVRELGTPGRARRGAGEPAGRRPRAARRGARRARARTVRGGRGERHRLRRGAPRPRRADGARVRGLRRSRGSGRRGRPRRRQAALAALPRPPARRARADRDRRLRRRARPCSTDVLRWEHVLDEPPGGARRLRPRGPRRDQGGDGGHRRGVRLRRRRGGRRRRPGGHADGRRARATTTGAPSRRRAPTSWSTTSPACPRARSWRSSPRPPSCAACCPSPPTTRRAPSPSASWASTT